MKLFRRFALLSTIGTYFVIYAGGLVRVSGAGLGCPDWPTCFGRWIPPTSLSQLPAEIDPARFNLALAWIEYMNRVAGMLLGIIILITAILGIMYMREHKKIMFSAILGSFLVALTGIQGMFVISSELAPAVVTVHMLLALLLASVMIYTSFKTYELETDQAELARLPKGIKGWVGGLWAGSLVQVVFGTQIRSALENLAEQFPLMSDIGWLENVGSVNDLHSLLGIAIAAVTWNIGYQILFRTKNISPMIRQASISIVTLVTLQMLIGVVFFMFGLPELARVMHMWIGAIFVGVLMLLFLAIKKQDEIG